MKLNAKMRNAIPARDFALPGARKYPINDKAHARDALARASGKPVDAKVKAKVKAKYPGIAQAPKSHKEWENL